MSSNSVLEPKLTPSEPTNGHTANGAHQGSKVASGPRPVAISVQNLSKAYTIQHQGAKLTTAAEAIVHRLKNPFQTVKKETFWALRDLSLDIYQGEVVGVIGRNGAGKSTFLKMLSRITEPTLGKATLHGRVGSLLEVGTGFHPELTGRENIFLNGAILGMTRREIERQFDAIVDFSGTERFLDTPVKRYSSGMYVRLAFAVAAHLDTEILVIDEVLAVGDSEFQKKCLGKMQDVASTGRTVLYVSHMMASVTQLCTRCIFLRQGQLYADGTPQQIIPLYLQSGEAAGAERVWDMDSAPGNDKARLMAARLRNTRGECTGDFNVADPIIMEVEYCVLGGNPRIAPVFHVYDAYNVMMFTTLAIGNGWDLREYKPGMYRAQCVVPGHLLNNGHFNFTPILTEDLNVVVAQEKDALQAEVHDDTTGRGEYAGPVTGVIRPPLPWTVEQIGKAV